MFWIKQDTKETGHTNKMVIMGGEGCVRQPYCGNRITMYICIKSSHCTLLKFT